MTEKRSTRLARSAHKGLQGLAVAAAILALVAGCTLTSGGQAADGGGPAIHAGPGRPGALRPAQAKAYLAQAPGAWVLDVRQPEEWDNELGHIEGSIQIPLPDLASRLAEIDSRKNDPVVVVCRSGRRSSNAALILSGSGFREVYNLEGGLVAWRQAGY